jgi:hypothetical protein
MILCSKSSAHMRGLSPKLGQTWRWTKSRSPSGIGCSSCSSTSTSTRRSLRSGFESSEAPFPARMIFRHRHFSLKVSKPSLLQPLVVHTPARQHYLADMQHTQLGTAHRRVEQTSTGASAAVQLPVCTAAARPTQSAGTAPVPAAALAVARQWCLCHPSCQHRCPSSLTPPGTCSRLLLPSACASNQSTSSR